MRKKTHNSIEGYVRIWLNVGQKKRTPAEKANEIPKIVIHSEKHAKYRRILRRNTNSDTNFIGEVSPRNPNERWSVDPNPKLTQEMTVLEAEERSDSE